MKSAKLLLGRNKFLALGFWVWADSNFYLKPRSRQQRRVSILELGLMVEKGEWWEVLEVSRAASNFSQIFFPKFVFEFCSYLVLLFCFSRASTLILGTPKDWNSPLNLQGHSYTGWV
jgi:hypothetical protein